MVMVMTVLMVEMVLMTIPMMLGVMTMTMAAIPPSGREKSAREFPFRRAGIAAIVIAITPSIIGIIINTISTISTVVTVTIPSHPAVAIVIVLLLVHWDRIPGVDYHL